jgi:hypothetical protein
LTGPGGDDYPRNPNALLPNSPLAREGTVADYYRVAEVMEFKQRYAVEH